MPAGVLCLRSVLEMNQAARGLFFAPAVVEKADAIVATMEALPQAPFVGVHLRIEEDWMKYGPVNSQTVSLWVLWGHMAISITQVIMPPQNSLLWQDLRCLLCLPEARN